MWTGRGHRQDPGVELRPREVLQAKARGRQDPIKVGNTGRKRERGEQGRRPAPQTIAQGEDDGLPYSVSRTHPYCVRTKPNPFL